MDFKTKMRNWSKYCSSFVGMCMNKLINAWKNTTDRLRILWNNECNEDVNEELRRLGRKGVKRNLLFLWGQNDNLLLARLGRI